MKCLNKLNSFKKFPFNNKYTFENNTNSNIINNFSFIAFKNFSLFKRKIGENHLIDVTNNTGIINNQNENEISFSENFLNSKSLKKKMNKLKLSLNESELSINNKENNLLGSYSYSCFSNKIQKDSLKDKKNQTSRLEMLSIFKDLINRGLTFYEVENSRIIHSLAKNI